MGRRSGGWKERQRGLREFLDEQIARIANVEGRSKAEVERLLTLYGVRAYNAGEPLRFRKMDFGPVEMGSSRRPGEERMVPHLRLVDDPPELA